MMEDRTFVCEKDRLLLVNQHGGSTRSVDDADDDGVSGSLLHQRERTLSIILAVKFTIIATVLLLVMTVHSPLDIRIHLVGQGSLRVADMTPTADDDIFDVIVFRATPAGCAAAIAAAEMGSKVLIIEPSKHIGGMATEGGIGLRDGMDEFRIQDPRNSQVRWGRLNAAHYGLQDGSVIWQPDNFVGEESFQTLLKEAGVEIWFGANVQEGPHGVMIEEKLDQDRIITGLRLEGSRKESVQGRFIIDASYEGELMIAAGLSYTFGREKKTQYNEMSAGIRNESGAQFPVAVSPYDNASGTWELLKYVEDLPDPRKHVGEADDGVMAYSYRVCLTQDPSNRVEILPPTNYDPYDFELARRLIASEIENNLTISAPWIYYEYMNYDKIVSRPNGMKFDACCGTSPFGIDNPALSRGYANGSRIDRQRIVDEHRYFVHGLLWFWKSDPIVPDDLRDHASQFGLCQDEYPDNDHFPRQLYVREAARLVGDDVFTQNDRTSACRHDSIAVATWFFDIHDVSRVPVRDEDGEWITMNEGLVIGSQDVFIPFDLPYWVILPKRQELGNLAVVNCPSVSHVAFSAIREEPTLWALGQAAGIAASIAVLKQLATFHDVDVQELRSSILGQGGRLHFPSNVTC
jgi:hypothetical protein